VHGERHDLRLLKNFRALQGSLAGAAWVHAGTPCSSFSRARRGKPGSPGGPLRTSAHVMGLPNLPEKDATKVAIGNKLLARTIQLIKTCEKLQIPISVENPRTSWLWRTPAMRRLLSRAHVVHTVFCAFGTSWQKATTFACWGSSALELLRAKCGGVPGICEHTGRPHRVLEGTAPGGRCWTLVAQPYPVPLVNSMVHCMWTHVKNKNS